MLTDEERKIAEENHNLIYFFINHFKVDIEEYYDLFAIDYINCIKSFDKNKGKLSTLLSKAFFNRIKIEQQKKNTLKGMCERKTISLNTVISKERS